MWDEKKLLEICEKYKKQAPENVMFPEPYSPYVRDPEKWNGILVLAEAQNMSENDKYYKWLDAIRPTERRMTRLGWKEPKPPDKDEPEKIGVEPWDDKTAKLALQAIFEGANLGYLKLEDVAVSNAVPWTKKRSGSKNENPDEYMKTKAKDFWKEIFEVWDPKIKMLVVLGDMAEEVMNAPGIKEKYKKNQLKLPSPSRRNTCRESGKFDYSDIGKRFPMVQRALEILEMSENNVKYYKNKVFYACQAVSLGVKKFKECFGT